MTYLLDTNVVSELRKARAGRADAGVTSWARAAAVGELFVSAVTIHELEIGVLSAERRDAAQGAILRAWLESQVLAAFAGRVLPVDVAVARRSAATHVPDPRPVRDAFIAATAAVHSLTVVTRNTSDFEPLGVSVLNPWSHSG